MSDSMRELWRAFLLKQDEAAFQPVYEATKALAWTLSCRILGNEHDARDAFQAGYLRLFAEIRSGKLTEANLAQADQGLYRLVVREAGSLRMRLHRRRQREVVMDPLPEVISLGPHADDIAAQKQLRCHLEGIMRLLPDEYRIPIQLHYFDGLSQMEIAEFLDVKQATISRRLAKGIKRLEPLVRRAGLRDALTCLGAIAGLSGLLHPPSAFSAVAVFSKVQTALALGTAGASAGLSGGTLAAKSAATLGKSFWAAAKFKTAATIVSAAFLIGVGTILTLGPTNNANRYAAQTTNSPITQPAIGRVVHFPKDRSLGLLEVQTRRSENEYYFHKGFFWGVGEYLWESFGEARGDVTVPPGKLLRLIVSSQEGLQNLGALLSQVKPDDLYSFKAYCNNFRIDPDQYVMPHLARLTGLKQAELFRINFNGECEISGKGLQYLKQIGGLRILSLGSKKIQDEDLKILSEMKSLEVLELTSTVGDHVGDKGISYLATLPRLRELCVSITNIQGPGLAAIAQIPTLAHLELFTGNPLGNQLAYLQGAQQLKVLELRSRYVPDEALSSVSGLSSLEELNLHHIESITNDGLRRLKNLPNLKRLYLNKSQVDDLGLPALQNLPALEKVDLPARISDAGLAELAKLSRLKSLWVGGSSNSPITDAGLNHLSALQELQELSIGGSGITDQGMAAISKLTKLQNLSIMFAENFSDAGLAQLTSLKSLRRFSTTVFNANLTISGLAALNAFPEMTDMQIQGVTQDNSTLNFSVLTKLETLYLNMKWDRGKPVSSLRDEDLETLGKLKRLRWLHVDAGGDLTDAGLARLSGLTGLGRLVIGSGSGVTDQGLLALRGMQQLYDLIISGQFTDRSFLPLAGLSSLSAIDLGTSGRFSEAAVRKFQAGKPYVRVNINQNQVFPDIAQAPPRAINLTDRKPDQKNPSTPRARYPAEGAMAPPIQLTTLDGTDFSLNAQRGKVVMLHFWATWCGPCVAQAAQLKILDDQLRQKYGERFASIDLSLDHSDDLVVNHVKKYGITTPQIRLGPMSKTAADYGVTAVPADFLIGPDGKILLNSDSPQVDTDTAIDAALAKYEALVR